MEQTIIIGGGQAGMQVALNLRGCGYDGGVTIIGAEPYEAYERPSLSKGFLTNADEPVTWVAQEKDASITFRTGCRVTEIDRSAKRVQLSDKTQLPYTNLVLATGGACRKLDMDSPAPFYDVRTIDDARQLYDKLGASAHVTIVGAGVIGLEVAASARTRGLEVSVVEFGSDVMNRNIPADFAGKIKDLHGKMGVVFHMNDTMKTINEAGERYIVELESEAQITTDCIVLGIGITPNTALAEQAGLKVDNGVIVSKDMRTTDPDIFAVGDIACGENGRIESWQNANVTAHIAATAICGIPLPRLEVPWFWSDQQGANIQVAGWPMQADQTIWRETEGGIVAFYMLKHEMIGACTLNAGGDMSVIRRMLNAGLSPTVANLADPAKKLRGLLKALKK